MPETAVSCESGTFPRVQKCSDTRPFHRMTQTIGEDPVVVGVLPPESILGALLLALLCLKLVGNGRRNKNPANARFGLGLFQNEHVRVALRALQVEEEDVFLLKRLHGRLVDTLELFGDHDGCCSACDAFRRNIDAVPSEAENFTDAHAARERKVDSQLKTSIITNIECEKNRLSIPDLAFLGYSLRNSGMESWIFLHKLPLDSLIEGAPQQTVDFADCRRLNETRIFGSTFLRDAGNGGCLQEFLIVFFENARRYFTQIHLTDDWIDVIPYQTRV